MITAKAILKDYKDYSKTSLVSFSIGAVLLALHFVFKNNKLPEIAEASLSLSIVASVFFIIYGVVDAVVYSKFYKTIEQVGKQINPILLILSLPLYPIKYVFLRNQIDRDFYLSCLQNIK